MEENEDEFPPDQVRTPSEVARRALALFGVWGLSTKAPRQEVLEWIGTSGSIEELTPSELAFVSASSPSETEIINYSWQSERLIMLLWALSLVADLPSANEQCDTSIFQVCFPPFNNQAVEQFIESAELRSEEGLWEMAERTYNLHWRARDSSRPSKEPVDIEIIQERHHAINWVTGYCGLPWDEVTTDT